MAEHAVKKRNINQIDRATAVPFKILQLMMRQQYRAIARIQDNSAIVPKID
ncbi:hypothetical protein QUB63_31155 [Microcoleus sp. ARI1-B5]|uniref:hypothetical protein n=1 Tax=unclassified Microcoleus TaxID=2642155 RepID=UPI002FD18480